MRVLTGDSFQKSIHFKMAIIKSQNEILFIILAYKIKFIQLIICFFRENLQCLLVFQLCFLYLPPTKTIKNWSLVLSKLIWFLSFFKIWLSWHLLNFSVFMNQPFLCWYQINSLNLFLKIYKYKKYVKYESDLHDRWSKSASNPASLILTNININTLNQRIVFFFLSEIH